MVLRTRITNANRNQNMAGFSVFFICSIFALILPFISCSPGEKNFQLTNERKIQAKHAADISLNVEIGSSKNSDCRRHKNQQHCSDDAPSSSSSSSSSSSPLSVDGKKEDYDGKSSVEEAPWEGDWNGEQYNNNKSEEKTTPNNEGYTHHGHHKTKKNKHKKSGRHKKKSKGKHPESPTSPGNHFNYVTSEKKYFDYFPLEENQDKYKPHYDDTDDVNLVLLTDIINNNYNNTETGRFSSNDNGNKTNNGSRKKRHSVRRKRAHPPGKDLEPEQQQRDNNAEVKIAEVSRSKRQGRSYYAYGTSNDPWNNRFSQPAPYNYYLPSLRPGGYYNKFPIAGVYYNPLSPPGTYSISRPSPIDVPTRFSGVDEEDDRVVWDIRYTGNNRSPSAGGSPRTTLPPPRASTSPPLIHEARPDERRTVRPSTTLRPLNRPSSGAAGGSSINSINQQPVTSVPPKIPSGGKQPPLDKNTVPSRCVWAIISCCLPSNPSVRYACFEQRGCHGAFWDYNPCATTVQEAALRETERYFD